MARLHCADLNLSAKDRAALTEVDLHLACALAHLRAAWEIDTPGNREATEIGILKMFAGAVKGSRVMRTVLGKPLVSVLDKRRKLGRLGLYPSFSRLEMV